jgi:multiple sugar transport system permease protein
MDMNGKGGRTIISEFDRRRFSVKIGYSLCVLFAVGLAVTTFYPLFWVFFGSLKDAGEIFVVPPTVLPKTFLWENFIKAWAVYEIPKVFLNTFYVFAGVIGVKLLVLSSAAYAISQLKVPFKKTFYLIFLATLILPFFAYIIPTYLVIDKLRLLDTYWALWLPAGADSFSLLLLKGFFDDIPKELFEAARIDGASETRILRSIVLPISKPILAVLSIFAFMGVWKDFIWQQIILPSAGNWTISVSLYYHSLNKLGATLPYNIQLAAMLLSTLPPMLIFLFFQKYLIGGVTLSGIKG